FVDEECDLPLLQTTAQRHMGSSEALLHRSRAANLPGRLTGRGRRFLHIEQFANHIS
ncbi:hypothetical protein GCK32_022461, partial [Trichostrongylus colubriformis]